MGWGVAALLYSLGAHAPIFLVVGALAIGALFTVLLALGLLLSPLMLISERTKLPRTDAEMAEWERKHPWGKQYRPPTSH